MRRRVLQRAEQLWVGCSGKGLVPRECRHHGNNFLTTAAVVDDMRPCNVGNASGDSGPTCPRASMMAMRTTPWYSRPRCSTSSGTPLANSSSPTARAAIARIKKSRFCNSGANLSGDISFLAARRRKACSVRRRTSASASPNIGMSGGIARGRPIAPGHTPPPSAQ